MRKSRILFTLMLLFAGISLTASATSFKNEDLHYVISYKWGLIHKDAGVATLSLRRNGSNYNILLAARTKPWADRFYQVRDTLKGTLRIADLKPLNYTKIAHENGKYGLDDITYRYTGNTVTGICKRYKRNDKGKISESSKTLTATGDVYDMLSIFYYLRHIDYSDLAPGKEIKATVFSGSKSETITIRNLGKERIQLRNGKHREAYHIKFNFTTDGKRNQATIWTHGYQQDLNIYRYISWENCR